MFQEQEIGYVYVKEVEEVKETLTTSSYVIYSVHTDALPNAIVQRTYKDFCWLCEQIYTDFPGYIAPAVPIEWNPSFEDNRRRALEKFLNRLSSHEELRKSSTLEAFLLANDASLQSLQYNASRSPYIAGAGWTLSPLAFLSRVNFILEIFSPFACNE